MYLIEAIANRPVDIEDLGLSVTPSSPKTITQSEFSNSICLAELIRRGLLRASPTSFCREEITPKALKKRSSPQVRVSPPPARAASAPLGMEELISAVTEIVRAATAKPLEIKVENPKDSEAPTIKVDDGEPLKLKRRRNKVESDPPGTT